MMTEIAARVEAKLQLLQAGTTPVPVVKELLEIATNSGVPLADLVDMDRLRSLCLQSLQYVLQSFVEGKVTNMESLNFGTFCARFRGQTVSLQRLLGEHDDFDTFMRQVEQVADRAFPLR